MSVVKEGYVKRYSKSMFSGGWNPVYVKLYSDSNLLVYKRQGDSSAKVQICLKNVCKHFAYGEHVQQNFQDIPALPQGTTISCLLAIPEKPSHKAKPHYFLLNSEQELHEWMMAIIGTLPQKQPGVSQQAPIQPSTASPQHSGPPRPYSSGPAMGPPMPQPLGFDNLRGQAPGPPYAGAPYQQQPSYYPQQAYAQQCPPAQPYPTQQYPTQAACYPQQQYYGQQVYGYQPPPPQGYYQQHPQGYAQPSVVYVNDHHKQGGLGGLFSGNTGKLAAGLIGGAALGYGASRMMGHGHGFGGFGMGRCGSWSSLSSFGSVGSFGSIGSFD